MLVKKFGVFREIAEWLSDGETVVSVIYPERIATVATTEEAEKEIDKNFETICAQHDCPMPADTPEKARLAKQSIYFVSEIFVWSS